MDADFHRRALAEGTTERGERFREALADELTGLRGQPSSMGLPALVPRAYGAELRRFVGAYHRAIEAITLAWRGNDELRRVVRLLPEIEQIVDSCPEPGAGRIHLLRAPALRAAQVLGQWVGSRGRSGQRSAPSGRGTRSMR